MLCEQHYLPYMIGIVRHLPVESLGDRMRLAANGDGLAEVINGQRFDIVE